MSKTFLIRCQPGQTWKAGQAVTANGHNRLND
ncbi:hypothetical protein BH09BAC4_BH09BAC4_49640 [soil metagenome]